MGGLFSTGRTETAVPPATRLQTSNRNYPNYQISAQPARSSVKAVRPETRLQTSNRNYPNNQISAQPARSSVKAVPPETQLHTSNGNYGGYRISAQPTRYSERAAPPETQLRTYEVYYDYECCGQPVRTKPVYSDGYLNTQFNRNSYESTSEDSDSNFDTWSETHFQLIHNQRKYADKIAKLKIYSNQRTNKINLVESTLNRNFSLENLTSNISNDSRAFYHINNIFMETTQSHYRILRIEEIKNPYLKLSYLLRRKEYCLLYGEKNVKETLQFHGTKKSNIEKIVNNNFNWRLHGKARGNIFGKGVSFSPISNYASNYCDKTEEKCMLAVYVLKSFSCGGNKFTIVPPILNADKNLHYDTTEKPDGNVCVKFRDDEFYPQYLIYFVGTPIKRNN